MSDDFLEGKELTQEQANALDRASERKPVAIKARELPERSRSDGPTWYTNEYKNHYNLHLFDSKNERIVIYLCITIVAIVAIIYW